MLTSIVKPPAQRNVINFKNFYESARLEIMNLFRKFDVEPLFLYAMNFRWRNCHSLGIAGHSLYLRHTQHLLGNALEERYGVPYVRSINPLGVTGFETWLRDIGQVIHKEREVEAYIAAEREVPARSQGDRECEGCAPMGMGPGYTYEVARVLTELGMEIVWGAAWHFDKEYDNGQMPPALSHLLHHESISG